ncbi:glycosyltransferase family 2 protein [Streptomyces echinoruber]|uniref:Uncharacterized protein n=1 Tax=Streptomyces echinoruber TaxID=68898 RepID=A0A918R9P5_9ACTN|nr:glycosyltransferase family 2 protein [Streptomyces echinoruber]GGZ90546.1 hypothetical protein GCM10010389_31100 [Streptomyces echinoruber]
MADPTVSVIIAAYNAMPYVTRCINSVIEQSIGRNALEVIVVNDGSTDGTAEEVDRIASTHADLIRVIHQKNSGGPSAPRNVGLTHARGKFVFFLDADDYLGPEALERMVGMAEENGTDIVLGKMVGVGGRGLPMSMFKSNQPKTDVFHSRVYWALNPLKLFRRDFLERHGLRFPTGLPIGEDQPFTAMAYLRASGISVVADYDCLFCTLREDGGNTTVRTKGAEPRLRFLPHMIDLLLEHVPPGPDRDHLAHRHLTVEVQQLLGHLAREPRPQQEKHLARLAEIIDPLWHEGMNDRLSAMARLRLHLVRHRMLDEVLELVEFERELAHSKVATPVLVEGGRAYARYPFFRDPARAVPDACYDVTDQLGVRHHVHRAELRGTTLHLAGHAYLHRVETRDVTTHLLLRERNRGTEYRLPVTHTPTPHLGTDEDQGRYTYDHAGFDATVDLATAANGTPLPDGLWDISLTIGTQGITREVRIGSKRAEHLPNTPTTHLLTGLGDQPRAVTLYTTKPHGNYTLDIGENKHPVRRHLTLDTPRWSAGEPSELVVKGRCTLAAWPQDALVAVLTAGDGTADEVFPAVPVAHTDAFTVHIDLRRLTAGLWRGELRLGPWSMPLPPLPQDAPPTKWRHRGLRWYAKPETNGNGKQLAVRVGRVRLVRGAVRRLAR